MSIRDQGYQRYGGTRTSHSSRWAIVLRHSLRMGLRKPLVVLLLCLLVLPLIGWGLYLYAKAAEWAQVSAGDVLASADPGLIVYKFQTRWYGFTTVFAFAAALIAGGTAVADDIRMNAFQFYFARSLSRDQYLLGRVLAIVIIVVLATTAPAIVLVFIRAGFGRSTADVFRQLLLLLKTLSLGTLEAIVIAVPAVALSSLSRRRGLVLGGFTTLFFLPWILGGIFVSQTRSPWPDILSYPALMASLGARLYGYEIPVEERPFALPWLAALIVVVAIVAGSIVLLRRRLASVEVVAG